MDDVSFRIAAGDRIGLVGRNGAGKTTLTKILAGEALPAGGTVTSSGSVGYLPQDPRTGDPEVLSRDRILSARGLDSVVRRLRESEAGMGSDDPDCPRPGDEALRAGGRRPARRGWVLRRGRGGTDRLLDRDRRPADGPAAAHPLRRPAPPGGARAHPVLRRRDAAPRRAHQPPRRRLDHLAARVPAQPQGRPGGHLPRRRPARGVRQPGAAPRRQPGGHRHLQHRLEGLPRPARDRREAAQARARQRGEQGQDADRPGQQDAGQGHQGPGRAVDAEARREADGGHRGGAQGRPRRPDQVPRARARAGRPRSPRASCPSPSGHSRCSPTSAWPSTRAAGS